MQSYASQNQANAPNNGIKVVDVIWLRKLIKQITVWGKGDVVWNSLLIAVSQINMEFLRFDLLQIC